MQEQYVIHGGRALHGEVTVSGAKNAALPLLFATLLTDEECVLHNVPDLADISVTLRMLERLGASASYEKGTVRIRTPKILETRTPYSLVKALRASFWVLGPLLARAGNAEVALPGGDAIGSRPVDLHLDGLRTLGAEITFKQGVVLAHVENGFRPGSIDLTYPSVGATHHLLMAAASARGETVIEGAAREIEVVELANLLSKMGARIEGAGSSSIRVEGATKLRGASHHVVGDRIEAATYLLAGAMTQGDVAVSGVSVPSLESTIEALREMGAYVEVGDSSVRVSASEQLKAASFSTSPAPGLATDVQPLFMAAASVADGTSVITETVFDNRFAHVAEYRRLGAQIELEGRCAQVHGVSELSGAPVEANDIRAAAGLVLLGCYAQGETQIHEIHHLDRGYERLPQKLEKLGASIQRSLAYEDKEFVFGC